MLSVEWPFIRQYVLAYMDMKVIPSGNVNPRGQIPPHLPLVHVYQAHVVPTPHVQSLVPDLFALARQVILENHQIANLNVLKILIVL